MVILKSPQTGKYKTDLANDMNMKILVNGTAESIAVNKSLLDFLNDKSLNPEQVVVEVNRAIVKRNKFREYILRDGDMVEILRFVGGG